MRLLNTQTLRFEEFCDIVPDYAVLSHRWEKEEVTLHDVTNDRAMTREGWPKVINCCRMAASRGKSFVWIDTCCIDKSSSAELSESINSMYAWYRNAVECYAYLGDVHKSPETSSQDQIAEEMMRSVWFTRGWTLQELIAPANVIFFNSKWEELWTKHVLSQQIEEVTHISSRLLQGKATLTDFSLAQRMAWAATRTTTRPEDEAYCLLGIFQVNMAMLYGEGKNAFRRLQEEIIKQSDDQTLFAWSDDRAIKPVLAPSVACFKNLHDLKCIYATNDARFGHTLSNSGLNIKLMLIPWAMEIYVAPLSCGRALTKAEVGQRSSVRNYNRMGIFLRRTKYENHLVRVSIKIKEESKDFVMLDSDVVAKKRNLFKIKDRQVFVRQVLVDMPKEMHDCFTFSFDNSDMFRQGAYPILHQEMRNTFPVLGSTLRSSTTQESYSHSESVAFFIPSHRSRTAFSHYLHLGYDLDFIPVCLITTKRGIDSPWLETEDFDGMSPSTRSRPTLSWLLSQIDAGEVNSTILAFKAKPDASTTVRCKALSLKMEFEVRETPVQRDGVIEKVRMWNITFERLIGIEEMPSLPPTPVSPFVAPKLEIPSEHALASPPRKRRPWLRFFVLRSTKTQIRGQKDWLEEPELRPSFDSSSNCSPWYQFTEIERHTPQVSVSAHYESHSACYPGSPRIRPAQVRFAQRSVSPPPCELDAVSTEVPNRYTSTKLESQPLAVLPHRLSDVEEEVASYVTGS